MTRTAVLLLWVLLFFPGKISANSIDVSAGRSVELRALDRLSGRLSDLTVDIGASVRLDRLMISVVECRYPTNNPNGDAFAYLLVDDAEANLKLFEGWMVASSPALNALDHMRYDVWVLRCNKT